jgi:hypothetical protein
MHLDTTTDIRRTAVSSRDWLPDAARLREREILDDAAGQSLSWLDARVAALIERNREIHEQECINLNPATNVMNPVAEAAMSAGVGSRPSLGYAGAKYEMGLEAIEEIEVLASELARQVFDSSYAEVRVGSGALANACGFLATCQAGDSIIVPPASIGGHATHHRVGRGLARTRHSRDAGRRRALHRRSGRARGTGPAGASEADHDRQQPQSAPASGRGDPGDRRPGGCARSL